MTGYIDFINTASGPWAAGMWTALWQSTMMAGVVFLIGMRFKKLAPAVRYWLWMFVGLRLLVMPFLTVELPVIPAMEQNAQGLSAGGASVAAAAYRPVVGLRPDGEPYFAEGGALPAETAAETTPAAVPGNARATLTWPSVFMLIWCAGVLAVLARLASSCLHTRRIISGAVYENVRVARLAGRGAQLFGLRAAPRVGITANPIGPFVYGAWNPVVILPEALVAQASDEQLLVVLAHEFAHVQRRDPLLGWVFAFCHAFYFFHPALPFVKRQLLLERERACDAWVLALSEARPSTYAKVLVTVAALCSAPQQPLPVLVAGESFQDLRTRLQGLRSGSPSRSKLSPAASVLLIVIGLLSVPGIAFTARNAEALGGGAGAARPAVSQTAIAAAPEPEPAVIAKAQPEQVATPAPATRFMAAPVKTRTLRFPPHHAVGLLKVKDKSIARHIDEYWCWNDYMDWTSIGGAQGDVEVPVDKDVWLTLNANGFGNTAFLRNMNPDDLYRVSTLYAKEGEASLDDKGMEDVAKLTGLRYLELRYSNVTDRGLKLLQGHPQLERIETPREMTDAGLAYLSDISTLRGLYIHMNKLTDTGMVHLEKLQGLEEMILGGGDVTDSSLVHLTKLPRLGYLMLWGTAFGDTGMLHVARIPALTNANLSNQDLTNRGVQYLSASPSIETLSLYGVKNITALGLQHLSKLETLKKLNLSCPPGEESNLNGYSMTFLAGCTSLETLDTPRTMDDAGLAEIAKLPRLKVLRTWNNSNNNDITDKGLLSVASVHGLRELIVSGRGITDMGIAAIAGMGELEKLHIMTESHDITNAGVAELANLTKLKHLDLYFNKRANITLSAISQLNALTSLTYLQVYGVHQDDSVLDLSGLVNLDTVAIVIEGGMRDEDLACFSGLENLRWLQGVIGITDAGVAHIAKLKKLDRLYIKGEGLTDAALEQLQGLTGMDTLTVEGSFTDSGLQHLRTLQGLHWLTVISEPPLSDAAQERLLSALPNVTVYNSSALAGRAAGG